MDFRSIFNENLENLRDLLKINSIYDENSVSLDAPYGKGPKDALLFMKNLALKDGFDVKEYDNKAISISYVNKDDRRIDIASHLDVVSVDDKWVSDPFEAIIKDNRIYGRGTNDMKTAAFLSYLCLKLLKDKYKDTLNEIRLVYGSDEERTMDDMRTYYSKVSEPLFAYSPDGSFPMAIGEKGALMWTIRGKYDGIIESLDGGIQCNIVPPICKLTLKNDSYKDAIKEYIKNNDINGEVISKNNKTYITINGIAVHCSRNWQGKNAIDIALKMIGDITNDKLAKNLSDILKDNYGEGLDSKSGEEFGTCLTVNLGVLKIINNEVFGQVDARYPSSITSDILTARFKEKCLLDISLDYDDKATLCDINDPYVNSMLETYRQVTGDYTKPFISGGVSYAKVFKHCVTFGITFPGKPNLAHQANEYVDIDECIKAFEIYYKSIEKLAFLEVN